MPRPKRKYTSKKQSIVKKDDTLNFSTMIGLDSQIVDQGNLKTEMCKAEAKERMHDALSKLSSLHKELLNTLEQDFQSLLMAMPKKVLNVPIDINNEMLRAWVLKLDENEYDECKPNASTVATPATVKRRSRSVSAMKYAVKRTTRLRSTSVDVYKTPKGRVRLSSIMSHKKYTVTKPAKTESSGLSVKRVMKPDEVAISTCGSPLYVASCPLAAPQVNIPLPGGVILNIEPKEPKGAMEVPNLDDKTRNQLKILCEQLKSLF